MTGRIKSLDVASGSGAITAEDGLVVGFCPSAVLAYDIPTLAIGQAVSFDLEDGRRPNALNIYVQATSPVVNTKAKRPEATGLRYVGFEHKGNIRAYLFESRAPGAETRTFTVNADLALFTRHRVGMQEGPSLCLHLLAEELDTESGTAQVSSRCSLSDREMLAYVASRPVPRSKLGPKLTLPSSGAGSHIL